MKGFSGLTIKSSLVGFMILLVVCLLALGCFSYIGLQSVKKEINNIEAEVMPNALQAQDMRYAVAQVQQWLTDASATGETDGLEEAEKYARRFREYAEELSAGEESGSAARVNRIANDFEPYYALGRDMAGAYINEGREAGNAIMPEFDSLAKELAGELDEYVAGQTQLMTNAIAESESLMRSLQVIFIAAMSSVSVILAVGCLFLIRKIVPPLAMLRSSMDDINRGEGDLTKRIPVNGKDEIAKVAQSFNGVMDNLKEIISKIGDSSRNLTAHSQELASSSEEVTATVEEVASTTNEVAAISSQGAENAERAANDSEQMQQVAEGGNKAVQENIEKMKAISQASQNVAVAVKSLGEQSNQIGEIINTITNIADQTNLLALNAAIEAARAGEYGKGFAVVADEVRKLAEQSAGAAREITALIEKIQVGVGEAVTAIDTGVAEVDEGVQIANNAGVALEQISKAVQSNTMIIQDLATGSQQINEGMQQVSSSNEQITATVQQVSSAAQDLASIAGELENTVNQFKV